MIVLCACSNGQLNKERINIKKDSSMKIVYDDAVVEIQTITLPTQYAQIYGGHYFYMRKINNRFVVYKDNAEKYADFSLGDSEITRIGIVNDYIYLVIDKTINDEWKSEVLERYSLKDQRIEIIDPKLEDKDVEVFIYNDSVYEISNINGEVIKYNRNMKVEKRYSKIKKKKNQYYQNSCLFENKLYYTIENKKKVSVFSYDFENNKHHFIMSLEKDKKQDTYFRYKIFKTLDNKLVIAMMFNWDDPWKVYFFGKNGKTKILNNIEDVKVRDKYIYYIDSNFGLYKSDLNLQNKKKISEKKFSEFDIVDNRIYAKKYNEWFHDARFDDYDHVEVEYGEEIETINID